MKCYSKLMVAVASLCLPALPAFAQMSEKNRQSHISFEAGGSVLSDAARAQVAVLGQVLNTELMRGACFRLVGYSDASGGAAVNLQISRLRAEAVSNALTPLLEPAGRVLEIEGVGASEFLADFSVTDPRQRRVAIYAKDCASS